MFMVKQHNSFLIYALLSRIKLCRDYALFGGHFWRKFDGRGHENILKDRALLGSLLGDVVAIGGGVDGCPSTRILLK